MKPQNTQITQKSIDLITKLREGFIAEMNPLEYKL